MKIAGIKAKTLAKLAGSQVQNYVHHNLASLNHPITIIINA